MAYVETYIAAVPTANKDIYFDHARQTAEIFKANGALRVMENWGTDVPDGEVTSMIKAVQCGGDETVVIGWVEWPSKAARDAGMEKAMPQMGALMSGDAIPFDGKRLIFGGFENMLEL